MLRNFLNNYFGFNKQQRNGIYILCCISALLLLIRIIYPYFITQDEIQVEQIEMFEDSITEKQTRHSSNTFTYKPSTLFAFDPNTISLEDLIKLGFKERTANTFIKFRSKGFKFKQVQDLKKVYGISEQMYKTLEPYVVINSINKQTANEFKSNQKETVSSTIKIELNTADSLTLIELKGVGPSYAKRILKYRSLLGGFIHMDQLKEIYGMTVELSSLIQSQCVIDAGKINKININTIDFKALNKHPYVSYETTKQIFNFRRSTKITEANLMDALQDVELVDKLKPYLTY